MDKNYDEKSVRQDQSALITHLTWALSKAVQIDAKHKGSILNELKEVEMALEFATGRIKTIRQEVQGHNITMPKGS